MAVISVVLLVSLVSAGYSANPAQRSPTAQLKVCTTGDYLPLTYYDPGTGRYRGIDIEMAGNLAAHLGRTAVFVRTTWTTLMKDLSTPGKCDIAMGGISVTADRQRQAEFTEPYLSNGKTPLTTTAHAQQFQTLQQINVKGVSVIEDAGGTNDAFVRQRLPNVTLAISADNMAVFGQLLAGKADLMITDSIEAVYEAGQHPGLVAVHPGTPFTADRKAYLLPKNSDLTGQVDAWLAEALGDGTFTRFYHQWMS
ncbi:MAG TPA: transporter substrate-binding domain-containing protein [Amycolatopsis sp.]|nr:transporter substrate-binding domain-containing protein [Amycolatopsis sp.]